MAASLELVARESPASMDAITEVEGSQVLEAVPDNDRRRHSRLRRQYLL
jgi:hypothetical protein